jgi:hypothetical protein
MAANSTILTAKGWERLRIVYKDAMHINGFVSLLTTILAVYMILFKSNVKIQTYKWYLLNIVCWSAAVDFYISVLYLPWLTLSPKSSLICSDGVFQIIHMPTPKWISFVIFK